MWRAVLALVLLLATTQRSAQAVTINPAEAVSVVKRAGQTFRGSTVFTEADLISAAGGSSPTRVVSGAVTRRALTGAARFIPYVGLLSLTSEGVNRSLGWYYRQAQEAANPVLLPGGSATAPFGIPALDDYQRGTTSSKYEVYKIANQRIIRYVGSGSTSLTPQPFPEPRGTCASATWKTFQYNASNGISYQGIQESFIIRGSSGGGQVSPRYYGGPYGPGPTMAQIEEMLDGWVRGFDIQRCEQVDRVLGPKYPTLEDSIRADPRVTPAVREVVAIYYDRHPAELPPLLSPEPNANQIADLPNDCTLDSDGDGVDDCKELEVGTNPGDPTSVPKGKDVISTSTVTTKNPDGSTTTTSTTTYSDGSKRVTTTTIKTELYDQGDSWRSVRTTTTTTAETTPGGQTTSETKVTTDEQVTPKDEVTATDEADCTAKGGTWTAGKCYEKEEPCPIGEEKIDGKCTPTKKDEPDPGNNCGDFKIARLIKYTGDYLKDVVFPCNDQDYTRLVGLISEKFPFSLVATLGGMFDGATGGSGANPLPTTFGPFTVDTSWADVLFLLIKTGWRAFLWWSLFTFIAHRLSGQVVLS